VRQPEWRTFEDFRRGIAALIPEHKAREFVASLTPPDALREEIERRVHRPLRMIIERDFGGRYDLATFQRLYEDVQQHEAMRVHRAELAKPWPDDRTKAEAQELRAQLRSLTETQRALDWEIGSAEQDIRRQYGSRERQERKIRQSETIAALREERNRVRRVLRQRTRELADLMRSFRDETTDEQRVQGLRYASLHDVPVDLALIGSVHDGGFTEAVLTLFRDAAPERRAETPIEELGAVLRYLRDRVRNPRDVQGTAREELMALFPTIEREPSERNLRYARVLYEFLRE
jgi:hypothetical protein